MMVFDVGRQDAIISALKAVKMSGPAAINFLASHDSAKKLQGPGTLRGLGIPERTLSRTSQAQR
jgi:hypothetical protein